MKTIQLKPIRGNSGLKLGNDRYKLVEGQTSIELPDDHAYEFESRYAYLIDTGQSAATAKPPKKKAAAVADVDTDETSL